MENKQRIYLDNAATTKIDDKVAEAINEAYQYFGNPSSLHSFGQEASKVLGEARNYIASFLDCEFDEIIFTSGGSEADNLAVRGIVSSWQSAADSKLQTANRKPHIVTTAIEHHAILHTLQDLEKSGEIEVTYIKPQEDGIIAPESIMEAIRDNTILVSVMMVNNETGAVQPIKKIGEMIKNENALRTQGSGLGSQEKDHNLNTESQMLRPIVFHSDAVQALEYFSLSTKNLGVDLLSLSAHKFHGPRGIGALYVKKGTPLHSQISGGKQELGLRAGTENLPGIVGMVRALELINQERTDSKDSYIEEKEDYPLVVSDATKRIKKLKEKLINGLISIDNARINGSMELSSPALLNMSFLNAEGEAIILNLDFEGIAVSSGSACTSRSLEPSHVLTAMGIVPEWTHGAIRFSLSRETTESEIDKVIEVLPGIIKKLREMSPL